MQSAINSGAIELHHGSVAEILDYTISMFNRFLQSNAELRLDESFQIYFKVLSLPHVKYPHNRRGPTAVLGCKRNTFIPGTLDFEIGFNDQPSIFQNMCLLTSTILGKEKVKANETKHYRKFNLLLPLCSGFKKHTYSKIDKNARRVKKDIVTVLQKKIAGQTMTKEIEQVIKHCKIPKIGPYNAYDVCPLLSDFFKCQIHLIEGMQSKNASIVSFPSKFDDSLPQIVLFKVENDHVTFVSNLKMFFRHFNKRICFGCFKTFSPRYKHLCLKYTCFPCRRLYGSESTYHFSDPYFEYCDSAILDKLLSIPFSCPKCFISITTENCKKGHITVCGNPENDSKGRAGFNCPNCGTFFYKGFPNAEMARLKHSCDPSKKNCKLCGLVIHENHQCLIKPKEHTKKWPNLAFFAFSYKFLSQCKACYEIKKVFLEKNKLTWRELNCHEQFENLQCDAHLISSKYEPEPNLAVIYKEEQRGIFTQYIVSENGLEIYQREKKQINAPYFSNNIEKPEFSSFKSYVRPIKSFEISRKNIEEKKKKSMIENFLLLVTQPEWQNTTFLSFGANKSANLIILKGLLKLDLIPFVVQKGNRVNLVSLDFLELRFLDASAYINGGLEEWCEMFELDEKVHYFPEK